MSTSRRRSSRLAPAIAAVLSVSVCSPLLAGEPAPGGDLSTQIAEAATLIRSGQLVQAKRDLVALEGESLSPAQRERVRGLLTSAERRLRFTDLADISLQKAELALVDGDLREAERQAGAVERLDTATDQQRSHAVEVLDQVDQTRAALAPTIPAALEQAVADFENEAYADAKAGFESVFRSGVRLSPEQLRTLSRYRDRVAQLESERGAPFEGAAVAPGLLQPGRVQRGEQQEDEGEGEQDQGGEDQAQPEDDPSDGAIGEALRFEAQRLLAEADRAFEEGRYNEALQKYQRIQGEYRDYVEGEALQRAQNRIPETRVLLGQGGGRMLDQVTEDRRLILQQARAEFDNLVERAREALAQGDTDEARRLASEARLRLTEARDFFAQDEFQNRLSTQQSLLDEIAATEQRIQQEEAAEREAELREEAASRETRLERERQEKIEESLKRIRALQMEQKYEEALQVVDQLLFIDPQNAAGLLLKDVLQDTMLYKEFNDIQRRKGLSYAKESLRMQEGMIIPEEIIQYPSDWPAIVQRRVQGAGAYADPPEDQRVLSVLETTNIPASFTDNTLEDVVNFIATITNLNVDPDWDSLAEIGVDRDTLVTLNLDPLPARTILNRVLSKVSPGEFNAASWAVNDGILVIASEEALRRNTFVEIYDIQDLLFQVPDFTNVPDLELGQIVQGGGGGSQQDVDLDIEEQLSREEILDRIIEIIQTNVDFEGWRDNGGDTGEVQELNGNLIVTNTAKNHRRITSLLSQLREVRAIQVNVEARFLQVSEDFFEQIGFDLDVIFDAENDQFQTAVAQQQAFSSQQPGTNTLLPSDLVSPFFGPGTPRTGSTPSITLSNLEELNEDPNAIPTFETANIPFTTIAPDGFSQVPVAQNSLGLAEDVFSGSPFANSLISADPALGMAVTFLDDIQVDLIVEATQADQRSVQLSAPRLTFANGRWANISVVTQQAFVSDLTPIVGTRSVAFDPEPGVVSSGFTLLVKGVVSADRRYVTMVIMAETSEISGFDTFTVSAQNQGGGTGGGGVEQEQTFTGNLEQPTIDVTVLQTSATVPDQGTVLLGGQRISNDFEVETGVPVLSKLPILNRFFTNRIDAREERTLLILLKPTILIQNEQEEMNFPGLLDSVEGGAGGFGG